MREFPHGKALSKGRVSLSGQIYLVTVVTLDREPIFNCFQFGRIVAKEFMHCDQYGISSTLAWIVMPDHFHWLMQVGPAMCLSTVVGNVKSHAARKINRTAGRGGGTVWQRGFHDHALRSEESVVEAARYLIANPIRAGLVRRAGDYPLWDAVWV